MITWITENVAIGEYSDAINEELLKRGRVDCILSLRGGELEDSSVLEEQLCKKLNINFFRVPVNDLYWTREGDQGNVKIMLRTAAYMLVELLEKYRRILIHCTAGIDRSPFVVAYWMASKDVDFDVLAGLSTVDFKFWISRAYKLIKEKRFQIVEHMEWI